MAATRASTGASAAGRGLTRSRGQPRRCARPAAGGTTASRRGSALPAATQASSAQSPRRPCGRSWAGSRRCPRPGRGSRAAGCRRRRARARSCACPGCRRSSPDPVPGTGSRSATALVEVCRPLPTALTTPTARSGVRDQPVDQGRLAHAGVPDQDRDPAGAARPRSSSSRPVRPAQHVRQVQLGVVVRARSSGAGQVGLGQAEQRLDVGVVRGDQAAVDEAGPRRRVGQRADDHQLVGVGDHHPFLPALGGGVVVVRGAAQHRACARRSGRSGPARRARRRCRRPGRPGRRPPPRRPSSRARIAVTVASVAGVDRQQRVPAAVDRDHEAVDRVGVAGPGPGAGARRRGRAGPGRRPRRTPACASAGLRAAVSCLAADHRRP